MTARKPLDLDAIEARANAATPGPWEAYTVPGTRRTADRWVVDADDQEIVSLPSTYEHGRIAEFIAAARTDMPALVAEVRDLRAERDALTAQLDAIRALHTDSPAGVCPSCARLADVSDTDDGLVDYPCPTLRAMGVEDTPPLPGPLAGYTVRPLPPVLCGATDLMLFGFGCTKPAGHTGDRHTAEVPGVGSYTWGYVPTPEEAAAGQDTPEGCPNCPPGYDCESGHYATDNPAPVLTERTWNPGDPLVLPPAPDSGSPPGATPLDAAIDADLRMVADTTGVSYEDVRELYDSTGTRAADDPDGDR